MDRKSEDQIKEYALTRLDQYEKELRNPKLTNSEITQLAAQVSELVTLLLFMGYDQNGKKV